MKKLFFAIIITAVLTACSSLPNEKEAFIMSKQIIEVKLQHVNMKFPFADYSYDITNDSLFTVESHFTSNNVRTNYRVKMHYNGGDWAKLDSWAVKDLKTW